MASKIVKFMVPIYIKVDVAYDATVTLCGELGAMEDGYCKIHADLTNLTSCEVSKKDLPKGVKL